MPNLSLSPEILERYLHREVEEGNISWHDFDRLKQFSSNNRASYRTTVATSALTSGLSVYYCRWYRKRPWSWTVTFMIAPIAFFVSTASLQAFRVFRFQSGLQDPKGLSEALERIIRHQQTDPDGNHKTRDVIERDDEHAPQNRWAELRNASASASESTWDKIRQSHEQPGRTSTPHSGSGSQIGSEVPGVKNRQTEQAEFDALLEAERKMSS